MMEGVGGVEGIARVARVEGEILESWAVGVRFNSGWNHTSSNREAWPPGLSCARWVRRAIFRRGRRGLRLA